MVTNQIKRLQQKSMFCRGPLKEHFCKTFVKLELVFIKHYAPNSLHLTVNSHHILCVKMLAKFSKGHNSGKNKMIFFFF